MHTAKTNDTIESMKAMGVEVHMPDIPAFQEATKDFYINSKSWPADLVEQVRALGK